MSATPQTTAPADASPSSASQLRSPPAHHFPQNLPSLKNTRSPSSSHFAIAASADDTPLSPAPRKNRTCIPPKICESILMAASPPARIEHSMGRRFQELAFTPLIKEQQKQHGSRRQYERMEQTSPLGNTLTPAEQDFLQRRDSFYMASVSETGWPYIQH